jgi:hypothetical protein
MGVDTFFYHGTPLSTLINTKLLTLASPISFSFFHFDANETNGVRVLYSIGEDLQQNNKQLIIQSAVYNRVGCRLFQKSSKTF